MKINGLARMLLIIFLFVQSIPVMISCDAPQYYDEDKSAIIDKWDALINKDGADITAIDIETYVVPSMTSSVATKANIVTIDESEKIKAVLDILKNKKIDFSDYPKDAEGLTNYNNSIAGKEMFRIVFKNSDGNKFFGLCIYDDNTADIMETKILVDDKESLCYTYHGSFNENVYGLIESFYNNEK